MYDWVGARGGLGVGGFKALGWRLCGLVVRIGGLEVWIDFRWQPKGEGLQEVCFKCFRSRPWIFEPSIYVTLFLHTSSAAQIQAFRLGGEHGVVTQPAMLRLGVHL